MVRLRVLIGAVVFGLLALGVPSPAQAYSSWTLQVDPCTTYCAAKFTVDHDKLITSDDDGTIRWTLTGATGEVPLPAAVTFVTSGTYVNQVLPPLAPGSYTLVVSDDIWGRWDCSIYNHDVCAWQKEDRTTRTFDFTWDGNAVTVISRPSVDAFIIKKGQRNAAGQRRLLFMIDTSWDHREKFRIDTRKAGKWVPYLRSHLTLGMAFKYRWAPKAHGSAKYRVTTLTTPPAVSNVVTVKF